MMSDSLVQNTLAWLAQVLIVGGIGGLFLWVFRVDDPRTTLIYGHLLLTVCLLLPVVQPVEIPLIEVDLVSGTSGFTPVAESGPDREWGAIRWDLGLFGMLGLGMAGRLLWLSLGVCRLNGYVRRSRPVRAWSGSLRAAAALTQQQARFSESAELRHPATLGWPRPVVLVPPEFTSLPDRAQTSIACHELLHVRRRDWIWTLIEELYLIPLWFHPAAWWIRSRMRLARERLVDAAVVRLTGDRGPYVQALIEAGSRRGPRPTLATGLGTRRHLPKRIRALLEDRSMSKRRLLISTSGMLGIVLATIWGVLILFPLTGQAELRLMPSPLTATAYQDGDPSDGAVEILAVDTSLSKTARESVVVELTYNVGGEIIDSRVLRGPEAYRRRALQLALGRRFQTTLPRLQVTVTFTGPVGDWVSPPPPPPPPPAPPAPPPPPAPAAPPAPPSPPASPGPIRVGGAVMESMRAYRVIPEYPPLARAARQQGPVVLEALIGTVGEVQSLRVVSGPELLRDAAAEAVGQWRYEPVLLDGIAVPVVTTVTVNFTLQ